MIYGAKSEKTAPPKQERESQSVFKAPSARHRLVILSARKKSPFCHILKGNGNNRPIDVEETVLSDGDYVVVSKTFKCPQLIPSRNLTYHATKGYRRISEPRL